MKWPWLNSSCSADCDNDDFYYKLLLLLLLLFHLTSEREIRVSMLFVHVLSLEEVSALCWPQIRGGPLVVSVFLYVVHRNFLHHRVLTCKSVVTIDVKNKITRPKTLGWGICRSLLSWRFCVRSSALPRDFSLIENYLVVYIHLTSVFLVLLLSYFVSMPMFLFFHLYWVDTYSYIYKSYYRVFLEVSLFYI